MVQILGVEHCHVTDPALHLLSKHITEPHVSKVQVRFNIVSRHLSSLQETTYLEVSVSKLFIFSCFLEDPSWRVQSL